MAEKIHYQQPAQLKGCFYFPFPNFSLHFAQPKKVAPSYQSSFLSSKKYIPLAPENSPLAYTPLVDTKTTPRSGVATTKSALVSLKSCFSLFTRVLGLLHTISSLVFFLFDTTHVEQNAHWRTIVVTQQ